MIQSAQWTSVSLWRLYHRSPIWITIHHMYLLCTSFHRTILQTTVFNVWYFITKKLGKTDQDSEVSSILGYDDTSQGNWFPPFRDKIIVSSPSARPLTMRPLCFYKTSWTIYPVTCHYIPEQQKPQQHHCKDLKARCVLSLPDILILCVMFSQALLMSPLYHLKLSTAHLFKILNCYFS
jgi:hypothetical protein